MRLSEFFAGVDPQMQVVLMIVLVVVLGYFWVMQDPAPRDRKRNDQ